MYIIKINCHLSMKFCYLSLSLENFIFSAHCNFKKYNDVECANELINVSLINFILYILDLRSEIILVQRNAVFPH